MKHRPALLLAILIYLTLDLSLAAMPGAFVFEPDESVESTRIRARAAAESVVLLVPPRDAFVLCQLPLVVRDRLAPALSAERRGSPVLSWRSRAPYDPAPPSEDPD
ncbi:MAG: hypothetical protein ACRELW_20030 [Candidatus Rokuibacteriota bacterium]